VRKTNALLLAIVLLIFTACEDKKIDDITIPVENTTEIFTSKDKQLQIKKSQKEKEQ